jgi:hypothetical protein
MTFGSGLTSGTFAGFGAMPSASDSSKIDDETKTDLENISDKDKDSGGKE